MIIFIEGGIRLLNTQPYNTIMDIKEELRGTEDPSTYDIVWGDRVLPDSSTLDDIGVCGETQLGIKRRPRSDIFISIWDTTTMYVMCKWPNTTNMYVSTMSLVCDTEGTITEAKSIKSACYVVYTDPEKGEGYVDKYGIIWKQKYGNIYIPNGMVPRYMVLPKCLVHIFDAKEGYHVCPIESDIQIGAKATGIK